MGPTTSALVRPAPLFSRPPPGAALRVMPPKKRVKLDEDDEDVLASKKANESATDKANIKPKPAVCVPAPYLKGKEKLPERTKSGYLKGKESEPLRKPLKTPPNKMRHETTKATKLSGKNLKSPVTPQKSFLSQRSQLLQRSQLQQRSPGNNNTSPLMSPKAQRRSVYAGKRQLAQKQLCSLDDDDDDHVEPTKQSAFLGVKFKRMKKANIADQIKRTKEGKLDLMTPDSILTSVHIKDLLTEHTFGLLPPAYQYQLLILLPECDREVGRDSALRLSKHALNNEFFSRSCQEFKDKLMDGEFNSDIIQRAKHEVQINNRIDPWKAKFFEPVYGSSTVDSDSNEQSTSSDKSKCSDEKTDSKQCSEATSSGTKDHKQPPNLKVVESSWASFLKVCYPTALRLLRNLELYIITLI